MTKFENDDYAHELAMVAPMAAIFKSRFEKNLTINLENYFQILKARLFWGFGKTMFVCF